MKKNVGSAVQTFYNKTPFPDYELKRFNDKEDLKLSAWSFAKVLDRSIPETASVIDVGTGTGQLSAFLSLRRKCVWGIDFSDASLKKANGLKEKLKLNSWILKKVDITDNQQVKTINKRFEYVLCLGVLHHTADAYNNFKNVIKLAKPGAHIAVGLYNTYGRIPLKVRILLAKTVFKNSNRVKDWFIRMQIGNVKDKERARGWWNDQYLHPHETTHTIGEVLRWFEKNNIEYIHAIPSVNLSDESDLSVAGVWNDADKKDQIFLSEYINSSRGYGKRTKKAGIGLCVVG